MILMFQDTPVAKLRCNKFKPIGYEEIYDKNKLPLGTKGFNDEQEKILFSHWYNSRAIPQTRPNLLDVENKLGMEINEAIIKSMAISITDCYWIKEDNLDCINLKWKDINYHNNGFDLTFANYYASNKIIFSKSPDFTTDGIMEKFWYLSSGIAYLAKIDNKYGNRLIANELVYNDIAKSLNINTTPYVLGKLNDVDFCASPCFVKNENENYISAMQIKHSNFSLSSENLLRYFSTELGFEKEIKEMIFLDCLLHNVDRHEKNFGFIKNSDEIRFVPMFDNGFCLGVNHGRNKKVTDADMKLFNDKRKDILYRYSINKDVDELFCQNILKKYYEELNIEEELYEISKLELEYGLNLIKENNRKYFFTSQEYTKDNEETEYDL